MSDAIASLHSELPCGRSAQTLNPSEIERFSGLNRDSLTTMKGLIKASVPSPEAATVREIFATTARFEVGLFLLLSELSLTLAPFIERCAPEGVQEAGRSAGKEEEGEALRSCLYLNASL